ncbi:hypothetical protein HELRODRAFT_67330, partial [Helobdella robusta]|uniref:Dyp-type peroxidase C-terminal domain-containing protein n=1 Tax=Helobdella robusta TaxID=6412 RepID=T1FYZ8_HELRO
IITSTREHALYLWIYIDPNANATAVARVVANLQSHVDYVSPPADVNENNKIVAGIGFGNNFYKKVYFIIPTATPRDFPLVTRRGVLGVLPATGGDVFIHAKSNSKSKLFELTERIKSQLPNNSMDSFEDVYGWVYKNGRDLSGFIDGTENPSELEERKQVAVERSTGGSFTITQKWLHNMKFIHSQSDETLEKFVGRTKNDSLELSPLPRCSHVARMVNSTEPGALAPFKIVRQSQPYGTVSEESGLFFIAYANDTRNFEYQLDNMVGKSSSGSDSGCADDIMRISKALSGNYWYFPGVEELKKML